MKDHQTQKNIAAKQQLLPALCQLSPILAQQQLFADGRQGSLKTFSALRPLL